MNKILLNMKDNKKTAVIIGAGPAGLTAGYELLKRTNIKPIIIEKSQRVGGLAKTISYKGCRMDIGGHRFFTKSDRILNWWFSILPLQAMSLEKMDEIKHLYPAANMLENLGPNPKLHDKVLLLRDRKSRFYFNEMFFNYPLTLNGETLKKLGGLRTTKIIGSYIKSSIFPYPAEDTLEQFWVNRFGRELAESFFLPYAEKVWGMSADKIKAEWGQQRIKGLSIKAVIKDGLGKRMNLNGAKSRKGETSLTDHFFYPKYGVGQMWDEVAERVIELGGKILLNTSLERVILKQNEITSVSVKDSRGNKKNIAGNLFFSSMPIIDLVECMSNNAPVNVLEVGRGLKYRDFMIVGLIVRKGGINMKDNWIYIQDPSVKIARVEIFNNWSPYMTNQAGHVVVGAEYFCDYGDELWIKPDKELIALAVDELQQIGLVGSQLVLDGTVIRARKAYPAYHGTFDRFNELRSYFDEINNLYLIGRNGMHKYNNMDHSMLAAMSAVDNIVSGRNDGSNIWAVNTEKEYHEKVSNK